MNNNETLSPDEQPGSNVQTHPTSTAWGSQPVMISQTEVTAVPDPMAATATSAGGTKPPASEAATITAVSASVVNLFGQYELLGEVARGGMGVVYRARQRGLDRLVALKMVLGFSGDHESALQRFLIEAKAAAALDHPNVVPVFDCGEIDGKMYFTMALVEGPNLKGYVESQGVLQVPEALSLFAQIVGGVAHAHAAGIIHRDLKPANVLMDKDGRPRVTDFGLAKKSSGNSELTGTGQIMGTPAYMPPEQARDSKEVGPPADVYSLGAILYFLLTGRPPFIGETVPDLLIKVVSEAPVPPSQINPAVPPDLEEICLRCLAKTPGERYADAKELAQALFPVVDKYVPRSLASLSSIPSRTSGGLTAASIPSTTVAGLSTTTAGLPEAPTSRKGRTIALAATAGLLAAAALFLIFSPPKKIEGNKNPDPVAVNNDTTNPGTLQQGNGTTTNPNEQNPNENTTVIVPTIADNDFVLKAELIGAPAPDNDGVFRIPNGTKLKVRLTAEKDCYVNVIWFDPLGEADTVLFPNEREPENNLSANVSRVVPGNLKYDLVTEPTKVSGTERLYIIASTQKLPPPPKGEDVNGLMAFRTQSDRAKLNTHLRGIAIRKKSDNTSDPSNQMAGAEIRFHVNP